MKNKYFIPADDCVNHCDTCNCMEQFGNCDCPGMHAAPARRSPQRAGKSCMQDEATCVTPRNSTLQRPSCGKDFVNSVPSDCRSPVRPSACLKTSTQTNLANCDDAPKKRENLNGQFPCPCMTVDGDTGKDNLWDLQFYRWWGWNWLKKREEILRQQMEKEGKRFSEEFPILMANYYATDGKQMPQQPPSRKHGFRFQSGCEGKNCSGKRWSLMKSLNNALKAFKAGDKDSCDVGVSCDCAANLNICGYEGIQPCGTDCQCTLNRECLEPYLHTACLCQEGCRCPPTGEPLLKRDYQKEVKYSDLCTFQGDGNEYNSRRIKSVEIVAYQVHDQRGARGKTPPPSHGTSLACADNDPRWISGANPCNECGPPRDKRMSAKRDGSVEVMSFQAQKFNSDDDYCCSCDDESCECLCCLNTTNETIQTSQAFIREKYTQTEKKKRKCCRCCRCCSNKNRNCTKCKDRNGDDSPQPASRNMPQSKYVHADCCPPPRENMRQAKESNTGKGWYCSPCCKTTKVRQNSIQCEPVQETKATCCCYDDKLEHRNLDSFLSQLRTPNYARISKELFPEVIGDTGNTGKATHIKLEPSDINAITSAKLRNFFLEGDVYSSPVTGKNYDLSYTAMETNTKIGSTKLLKPLDVTEELKYSKMSSQCLPATKPNTKLMSALCDAILAEKPGESSTEKGMSSKIDIGDFYKSPQVLVLHTIKEDNETFAKSEVSGFDSTLNNAYRSLYKDEFDSANVGKILEIQENFRNKIEKLEGKIDRLMNEDAKSPKSRNKPKPDPKNDDPIATYETLLTNNRKRVDDLLSQLDSLQTTTSSPRRIESTQPTPSCCFDEDLIYKADLGPSRATSRNVNANTALDELSKFLSGHARCESNVEKRDDVRNKKEDFSDIVFTPCGVVARPQNFIVENLPSFNSAITDSYNLEMMLNRKDAEESVCSSNANYSSDDSQASKSNLSVVVSENKL